MANHLDDLKRRRAAWAKEIGGTNEWSDLAPQFVRELDAEIAAQGIAAGTDETPKAAQPAGQEPGPKDAPAPCSPSDNLSGDGW